MLNVIRNLFKKISTKPKDNKILLGRWGHTNPNLKSHFANHDNCGDKICKDPIQLKNNIKNEK